MKLKKPTIYPVSEVPSTGTRRSIAIIALKDIPSSGPNKPADRDLQRATVVSFFGLEGTRYITTDCLPNSSAVFVKTVGSSPDVQHQEEGSGEAHEDSTSQTLQTLELPAPATDP